MTDLIPQDKLKKATGVICKQGMFPFPLSEIAIISRVVKEEKELDLICAFNKASSLTMEQLKLTSGFSEEDIQRLTNSLAKAGLLFNQPGGKHQQLLQGLLRHLWSLAERDPAAHQRHLSSFHDR